MSDAYDVAACCSERLKVRRTWRAERPAELARKPPESLEFIVVHEMAHLVEPTHGGRFMEILDRVMPGWQHRRDQLNQLPVPHEGWNA